MGGLGRSDLRKHARQNFESHKRVVNGFLILTYVTNTQADGSLTISAFQNGRLLSVTRKDSGGTQIAQTPYGYDVHGRQATVANARNGTTSLQL